MVKLFASLFAGLQFLSVPASLAAPSKELYELKERCGKRAEEWFRSEWGKSGVTNTSDGQAIASFRNHFNESLNKCFVLLTYQSIPYKDKKSRPSMQVTLFDINDNKEYGSFFKFNSEKTTSQCYVGEKYCTTNAEWEALIAPYMGD